MNEGQSTTPARSVGREALWLVLARAFTALAGIVSLRVLTTVLPDWLYGRYALLLGYLALIAGFFVGPIAQAQNRFLHEAARDGSIRSFVGRSVATVAAAACIGGLLGIPLVWWYWPDDPKWPVVAGWCVLTGIFGAVASREQGLFNTYRWRGRYALLAAVDAWGRLGVVVVVVLLFGATMHAISTGLAFASLLTALVGLPWLLALARVPSGRTPSGPRFDTRPLWHFAYPLFGVALLSWVTSLSDRYIVGNVLGDALVGRYVAGCQIAAIVPGLLSSLYFPLVSPLLYQDMAREPGKPLQLDRYAELAMLPALLLAGLVVADVEAVCRLLLGNPALLTGDIVVPWVSAALVILVLQQVLEHEAFNQKSTRGLLAANVLAAVVNVLLNVTLIPRYGLVVPALSTLTAYLASLSVVILVYRPHVSGRTWARLGAFLLIAVVAILVVRSAIPRTMPLVWRGPLRWLLYGGIVGAAAFYPLRDLVRWSMRAGRPPPAWGTETAS